MGKVETIKVKSEFPGGFVVINKSDFDPKVHKLFEEEKKPTDPPETAASAEEVVDEGKEKGRKGK